MTQSTKALGSSYTQSSRWRKASDWMANATYLVAAVGCFGLAIYSIWLDRAGSAGVAATFAVAFLFLRHLPIIESFKAFNMEAKFARRVDEFDKLLSHIRTAAEVTSRVLYLQLGYSDRMTSLNWGRKREFMEELDSNLAGLGVDESFIRAAKRPILNFASWDLYSIFFNSARHLSNRIRADIASRRDALFAGKPVPAADPEWNRLHEEWVNLALPERDLEDMSSQTALQNVSELITEVLEGVPWPASERAKLELIAGEVEPLVNACWEHATVTEDAEAYIERYGNRVDTRLKEIEGSD